MRLRECIIAGASGTHSACICTIPHNVKLMMAGYKMEDVIMIDESEIHVSLLTCTVIIQDAIKGYRWANKQATLHAYVYYLNLEDVGLTHGSYVVINSDCNIHDAVAVHQFQRHLVEFLMSNLT